MATKKLDQTGNLTLPEMNPDISSFYVTKDKFYLPQGLEVTLALAAFARKVPFIVDGPTGSGKSSLAEHLCYRLGKGWNADPKLNKETNDAIERMIKDAGFDQTGFPMFTIQGQDDLSADDLRGRVYIVGQQTMWQNGSALLAARHGGMFYFDEPGEARPDTLVVTHSVSDHRRVLAVEKLGISIPMQDTTFPMLTYNSAYQDPRKKFKPSTSQRFAWVYLGYPEANLEQQIVEGALKEEGVTINPPLRKYVQQFIAIATDTRNLASTSNSKLAEGASPREVIAAAKLASSLKDTKDLWYAAMSTLCHPLSTDPVVRSTLENYIRNQFPKPD